MRFHSYRWLLYVLLLSVGFSTRIAAWPPVPPVIRPWDDPSIDIRFKAWRRAYEQSVTDSSTKLNQARSAIRDAKPKGGIATEVEKQAAREFVVARKKSMERLNELGKLIDTVRSTASAGDLNRLKDELNWQRSFFQSTESNTLEIFEAMID